jgi:Family of unknown function (DUF5989)
MLESLRDVWGYMREHKKLWLAPFVTILLVAGIAVVLSEYTVIAPFIYTLF